MKQFLTLFHEDASDSAGLRFSIWRLHALQLIVLIPPVLEPSASDSPLNFLRRVLFGTANQTVFVELWTDIALEDWALIVIAVTVIQAIAANLTSNTRLIDATITIAVIRTNGFAVVDEFTIL